MIRINLLAIERGKAKKKVTLDLGQQVAIGCGVLLVLAVAGVGWRYWSLSRESNRLDADLSKAQAEKVRLDAIIKQVAQYEQQRTQLSQRVVLIEQLKSGQTGPVHLLDEISRALPARVWLSSLKQSGANDVALDGDTTTPTQLSDFIANLEASGYFKRQIDIVSAVTGPAPAGFASPGDVTKFSIKGQFQQPGAAQPPAAGATSPAAQPARPSGRQ